MEIYRYKKEHEDAVLSAISKDPNWSIFTNNKAVDNYKKRLGESVTYVCLENDEICGYVRAILDDAFAVYVSELFVVPEYRGRNIGRTLLAWLEKEYEKLSVYVLSDEDAYYEKLGYRKIGSVLQK